MNYSLIGLCFREVLWKGYFPFFSLSCSFYPSLFWDLRSVRTEFVSCGKKFKSLILSSCFGIQLLQSCAVRVILYFRCLFFTSCSITRNFTVCLAGCQWLNPNFIILHANYDVIIINKGQIHIQDSGGSETKPWNTVRFLHSCLMQKKAKERWPHILLSHAV